MAQMPEKTLPIGGAIGERARPRPALPRSRSLACETKCYDPGAPLREDGIVRSVVEVVVPIAGSPSRAFRAPLGRVAGVCRHREPDQASWSRSQAGTIPRESICVPSQV